ncbi:crotonase/enoyl-CoA hydratase family protein [uncultured Maribacter sp.]|uniref:crotonase/enoyl-CoA hydratase family protein n=1 Tax=uncultured Maribacter sp. TaxID=431308 RepID=UPI0030DD6751|tara:strand:+ start:3756 stop:4532 length:777 start_codon:yes stop_codon:yes gene_type:complete
MKNNYTNLLVNADGAILTIALNREKKRNAINTETIEELEHVFIHMPNTIKSVIIYGKGNHFCAGLDLSDLKETNSTEGVFHSRKWHRALDQIQNSPAPVIALLNGACVGGGLELASACHIRVAERTTFYALPEGQRGIFVGGGGSVRIPRLIGVARMTDMMLTGRVYKADEGYLVGFSQYVEKDGLGMEKALELANKISGNAPMTNYALTNVLPRIVEGGQDVGLMLESMTSAISQDAPEAKQRLKDFLEGRAKKVGE